MIGTTISHYKIVDKIGGGGMGVVYKAEDIKLRRTVALKFLPQDLTRDPTAKRRFIKEAQTASALDDPHISNIHEIDETDDGQLFICMTYYEGETLQKKIEQGPIGIEEAITVALQVAQGLFKAHSKGIIHRDIKPGNIFITDDGVVKILDFGLAKLVGETRITKEGTTAGTIAYMSPEQARGEAVDDTTDIWSLGVVLYEMLTGRLPFKGENWRVTLYSILNADPESVRKIRADIPDALKTTLDRMIQKDRKTRYQDTTALITDLCNAARESGYAIPQKLVTVRHTRRKLNKLLIPIVVIGICVAALLITKITLRPQAPLHVRKAIAVMAFENLSGDDELAYLSTAIPNLLITSLQETGQVDVITWERMRDLARAAGKETELIDEQTGFEICRRQGIETVVLGSFTRAGDVYATDAKVLDVKTKRILKSTTSKGTTIASIINNQVDELSYNITIGIGVHQERTSEDQSRISDITTSSMEAYAHFIKGREYFDRWYSSDARHHFEAAIELDSTFATAYLYLAWTLSAFREDSSSDQALMKAREFSGRATERESLYIEASYAGFIEENWEKYGRILNLMVQKYPNEKRVYTELGYFFRRNGLSDEAIKVYNKSLDLDPNFGEALCGMAYTYLDMEGYNKALHYFKRYQSVYPDDANTFDTMADIYFHMGNHDEAIVSYKEALQIRPDFIISAMKLSYLYALREEYDYALQWCNYYITHAPSPGKHGSGHSWKAFFNAWIGNHAQWEHNLKMMTQLWNAVGYKFGLYSMKTVEGALYYELGDYGRSRDCVQNALDSFSVSGWLQTNWVTAYCNCCLALIDVEEGKYESCRSRLKVIEALIPKIFRKAHWIEFHHHLVYAELLLKQDSLEKSIQICKNKPSIGRVDFSQTNMGAINLFLNSDVLARIYLRKGETERAIREYENLVTLDPKSGEWLLINPKYHYRLAQLYEEKGRYKKAIAAYEKYIGILNESDAYQAEVNAARRRLAALRK